MFPHFKNVSSLNIQSTTIFRNKNDLIKIIGNAWTNEWGNDHGIRSIASTLHWGPDAGHNCFQKTHGEK